MWRWHLRRITKHVSQDTRAVSRLRHNDLSPEHRFARGVDDVDGDDLARLGVALEVDLHVVGRAAVQALALACGGLAGALFDEHELVRADEALVTLGRELTYDVDEVREAAMLFVARDEIVDHVGGLGAGAR